MAASSAADPRSLTSVGEFSQSLCNRESDLSKVKLVNAFRKWPPGVWTNKSLKSFLADLKEIIIAVAAANEFAIGPKSRLNNLKFEIFTLWILPTNKPIPHYEKTRVHQMKDFRSAREANPLYTREFIECLYYMRSVFFQIRIHQFAAVQRIQEFGEAVESSLVLFQIECSCDVAKSGEIPSSQNQQMRLCAEARIDKSKRTVVKLGAHWFSSVEIRDSCIELALGHITTDCSRYVRPALVLQR
jgi:hypothetical protein